MVEEGFCERMSVVVSGSEIRDHLERDDPLGRLVGCVKADVERRAVERASHRRVLAALETRRRVLLRPELLDMVQRYFFPLASCRIDLGDGDATARRGTSEVDGGVAFGLSVYQAIDLGSAEKSVFLPFSLIHCPRHPLWLFIHSERECRKITMIVSKMCEFSRSGALALHTRRRGKRDH